MSKQDGSPVIDDIAVFVSVAEHASFTRAAERLGTSKSNVGKAVQRLEGRLGTRLFQRTTRAVRLTEDGGTYLEAARAALDGLKDAEVALAGRRAGPAGRVRLDIPVGFGRLLLPTFAALRARHPQVTLELSLSDRPSAPVAEGWDLVVRIGGSPVGGDLSARKLGELRLGLYASPGYLERGARLTALSDLSDHEAIMFRAASGRIRPWTVVDGGSTAELSPTAGLVVSDGRAVVDAAIAGLGIAQIFDCVASPHVAAGELRHVLPEADASGPPVHALIPSGHRMLPKTRVVLDHLSEVLRTTPRKRDSTPR